MNMLILLTLLQIVSLNVAYNFTCPSSAHWKIRAKSKCEPPRNYTCLFDVTYRVNVYRERCSRPRILAEGYKYVFQPNLNRATCSATRYQPFLFDTNGYSDCTYQKSLCSSLGQETYEIGNTSVDRLCTCNTDKGYSFFSSSKQQCYCNPLTEDCSCYLGINQSNKMDGLKDIKCYDDVKLTRSAYLGDLLNSSRTIKIVQFDNFKYNLNFVPTNKYRIKAATSIWILLLPYFAVCIIIHKIIPRWIPFRNNDTRMKKIPGTIVEVEQRKYKADSEDQSSMTDDSKKPPGGRSRQRLVSMSEESESESESSETDSDSETSETDTETETDDYALPSEGSMVVMDAQRPYDEVRVQRREREIGRGSSRRLKEYEGVVERKSEYSPRPPETPKSSRHSGGRKQRLALLEVQDEVELNSSTVDDSFVEERRVAVPCDKLGASRRRIIDEGQMITSDGDGILPAPSISVESRGMNGLRVCWKRSTKGVDPKYKLLLHVVKIFGTKFAKEINNSDVSFECNFVEHNKPVRGLTHCWNVIRKNRCDIKGLVSGMTYRVCVFAKYTMLHGEQPCQIQTSSSDIYYTTFGPPRAPKLKIVSVDMYAALIEWDQPSFHKDLHIKGFQIYVDNKPLGRVRNKDTRQMKINNMMAGGTMGVYVVAVAQQGGIESEPSRKLHITCPRRPPAVAITQQPSHKAGCVLISWNRQVGHTYYSKEEDISLYGIYVDGKWNGKIKANKARNLNGYQYNLNDLTLEQTYDINVKAIAGFDRVDPDSFHVFSLSDSLMSNSLPVSAPAAPKSPKLMLEGLHTDGIDVSWQTPRQFGDASISGYQMLKNGKLYGSFIPSYVNSSRISDITLGEKITLQLIALTDNPVGRNERRHEITVDRDSGIDGSRQPEKRGTSSDLFLGDRYAGCRPGAKLMVHYTGLVLPPSAVWCEQVSGHSALIVWNKDDETRSHFIRPENYQVTWWPGDRPEEEINSDSTNDDHMLITNLRPSSSYEVVVEGRKIEKYTDIDEEENKGKHSTMNSFIIASKAEPLTIKTARPPDPPSNLGIMATTCSGIKLAWDQPREHGVEVIGIRVDAVSVGGSHHVSVDVLPDSNEADIEDLTEKTDYLLRVTAITDEYFDRLPEKHKLRAFPKDKMINSDHSKWLPYSSIISKTAGTEPAANIWVSKSSTNNMKLTWLPPIVYGSNELTGQIVRWWDVKATKHVDDDFHVACHKNLLPSDNSVVIEDLVPGIQYKIVIEAVVSVKTALEKNRNDGGIDTNRRTAHVMSKPMFARARAPTEPPRLYITGYTQTTAQLYWEKPVLVTVTGKDENGKVKYLRRYLEGYKLEINGKTYSCLGPNSQSCSLTKCKPGKTYLINLVALTCTEEGKKERNRKFKGVYRTVNPQNINYSAILDDEDNLDASPSETLEVILPRTQEGNIIL